VPSRHGKGWRSRWTDEHGSRHSRTFKYRRNAEALERRMKAQTEEVVAGLRAGLPPVRTFDELCDDCLSTRALQKRSAKHDKSIVDAHLRREFGAMKVWDIGAKQVGEFVKRRNHLDRKTVWNHLASVPNDSRDSPPYADA
jgi:hypothetical protein